MKIPMGNERVYDGRCTNIDPDWEMADVEKVSESKFFFFFIVWDQKNNIFK